jgi:hypothetical protein
MSAVSRIYRPTISMCRNKPSGLFRVSPNPAVIPSAIYSVGIGASSWGEMRRRDYFIAVNLSALAFCAIAEHLKPATAAMRARAPFGMVR